MIVITAPGKSRRQLDVFTPSTGEAGVTATGVTGNTAAGVFGVGTATGCAAEGPSRTAGASGASCPPLGSAIERDVGASDAVSERIELSIGTMAHPEVKTRISNNDALAAVDLRRLMCLGCGCSKTSPFRIQLADETSMSCSERGGFAVSSAPD